MSDLLDACMRRTAEFVKAVKPELQVSETQLKEYINSSYECLVLLLANKGLAGLRQEVVLAAVPAGTTLLTPTSTPSVPGMLAPIRLWERLTGGTTWIDMKRVIDHLPVNATQSTSLVWWNWRNNAIEFVGSTSLVDVKIHYSPRAVDFQMPRDAFGFPDLVNPVAFTSASAILGGNPYYDDRSQKEIYNIASIDVHLMQSTPVRLRRRRLGQGYRR